MITIKQYMQQNTVKRCTR